MGAYNPLHKSYTRQLLLVTLQVKQSHHMSHRSTIVMPTGSAWGLQPEPTPSRSLFGSIRKLGRKSSNVSQRSTNSTHSANSDLNTPTTPTFRGPGDMNPFADRDEASRRRSPSPLANPSPATRRPDRPGMNAFTVPSNEPPPAYTPSPTVQSGPTLDSQISELAAPAPLPAAEPTPAPAPTTSGGEDPYSFLGTFDTTLLIDDSGSMAGRSWREVGQAISTIAPIVTQHDEDGIDVYFMNHKSSNPGAPSEGIAPGGYRGIKRAATVHEIFERVRPQGGTPTGIRVHNILKPYLAKLESEMAAGRELKPLNLIVLTDGVPSFQVGNEEGAKESLEELDDGLSELVEGGVRY